jgi:hypothetical protein
MKKLCGLENLARHLDFPYVSDSGLEVSRPFESSVANVRRKSLGKDFMVH